MPSCSLNGERILRFQNRIGLVVLHCFISWCACISYVIITLLRYFLIPKSRDLVSNNPGISGLKKQSGIPGSRDSGSRDCNPYAHPKGAQKRKMADFGIKSHYAWKKSATNIGVARGCSGCTCTPRAVKKIFRPNLQEKCVSAPPQDTKCTPSQSKSQLLGVFVDLEVYLDGDD